MNQEKEPDYQFKIILVGDTNVGKSNLIMRYTMDKFSHDLKSTIGVEFGLKDYTFEDGVQTRATIYDTAGQERYRSLVKTYFRGAHGALIVYDVTNAESFRNVVKWASDVREFSGNSRLVMVVVGNKVDLAAPQPMVTRPPEGDQIEQEPEISARENADPDPGPEAPQVVSKEEAVDLVQSLGADVAFMETSALTRENVDAAFDTVIREIYDRVRMDSRIVSLEGEQVQVETAETGGLPQSRRLGPRMETIELDRSPRGDPNQPAAHSIRDRFSTALYQWKTGCSDVRCDRH